MGKSPGHQKRPDHKITEKHVQRKTKVEVNGEVVADSNDVIRVEEDGHPVRYYLPRSDVRMEKLQRSQTTSECPFKGTAHYYNLILGDKKFDDAVWTYEDPYEEHRELKDRLAFYDDKVKEIHITPRI